ncbi:MAG: anhydro-N-acetylmuramic acid kinase [Methylococcales bacterium]|nr:anhydro-N-acetylmuramic acid kinase [Methylococcales bacterium]
MPELYIGLMSGTSLDGIDASLVEFNNGRINPLSFEYTPFSDSVKKSIQQLSQADTPILLTNYGAMDTQLGHYFAQAVNTLLSKAGVSHSAITAIGSHGQTIYHAPDIPAAFSLQIGDPNIIAETTKITTVADFRRRDIALGGQGAPLVPAFHHAFFSPYFDLTEQHISIVNIGGISNLTYLSAEQTIGFDIGPGNALMDDWIYKNLQISYDKGGQWAQTGTPCRKFIDHLKQDPYFKLPAPKSTGKEYFSSTWLENNITAFSDCSAQDIQASLCLLTAETIVEAIQQYAPKTDHILLCGGGVHNTCLVQAIETLHTQPVSSTEEFGIHPDHVEAVAFAWLAKQSIHNLSGNLPQVTGAKSASILGGIYPYVH